MDTPHTEPNQELVEHLEADIKSGDIEVNRDDAQYFRAMESHFPIGGSQIYWSKVPGSISKRIDYDDYDSSLCRFLDEIVDLAGLQDTDQAIVIGDDAMNCALKMDIATLRKHLPYLIAWHQHTYIISPNISWCACYSMEGDMDFGFSPD